MHIVKLTIDGFKSYKEPVVLDNISGRLNLVVGRNGSGKSNFLSAIRFVLGDLNVTQGERSELLFDSTIAQNASLRRLATAYVEVEFEGSGKHAVLRRTVSLSKDEYMLDGKTVSKAQVERFLETAGFSPTNPYYVVPQGRVTSLAMMHDKERLNLIKDVSGVSLYDKFRGDVDKLLEECNDKLRQFNEKKHAAAGILGQLENDSQELARFRALESQQKDLERALYKRNLDRIEHELSALDSERAKEADSMDDVESERANDQRMLENAIESIEHIEGELGALTSERARLVKDKTALIPQLAQVEYALDEGTSSGPSADRIQELESLVAKRESDRKALVQKLAQVTASYEAMLLDLGKKEAQENALAAKLGRRREFTTQQEWTSAIEKQTSEVDTIVTAEQQAHLELKKEKLELEMRLDREKKDAEAEVNAVQAELDANAQELAELQQQYEAAVESRKEAWKVQMELAQAQRESEDQLARARKSFYSSLFDRSALKGLATIEREKERLISMGNTALRSKYYGPLVQLMDVPEIFYKAVEAAVGSTLMHAVVQDQRTALDLLGALVPKAAAGQAESSGRVTFIPMDSLVKRAPVNIADTIADLDAAGAEPSAVPLKMHLRYDPKFEPVMDHVFGRIAVCKTAQVASTLSSRAKIVCVTLDGDRVDPRGVITGGFQDVRASRLAAAALVRKWSPKAESDAAAVAAKDQETAVLDQKVTHFLGRIEVLDAQRSRLISQRQDLQQKFIDAEKSALHDDHIIRRLQEEINESYYRLEAAREHSVLLSRELDESVTQDIHAIEAHLTDVREQVVQLRSRTEATLESKAKLQSRSEAIEYELSENLMPRLKEMSRARDDLSNGTATAMSADQARRTQLEAASLDERIAFLDTYQTQLQNDLVSFEKSRNTMQQLLESNDHDVVLQRNELSRHLDARLRLAEERKTCVDRLAALGYPSEDNALLELDAARLTAQIKQVKAALRALGVVNRESADRYAQFAHEQNAFDSRNTELASHRRDLEELVRIGDGRRDRTLASTIAKFRDNLKDVFSIIVPEGNIDLVPVEEEENDEDDMALDDSEPTTSLAGLALRASFNAADSASLQQLSGGQKTVVALACVFALQKIEPAPFYLFDEVDAALDPARRERVAAYMHELSLQGAQYLSISFHHEIVPYADKLYGVYVDRKVSRIATIGPDEAYQFLER